jgi:hypothetical protein
MLLVDVCMLCAPQFAVPINDYVVSLEYAADIIGSQLLFNFFNIVLVSFECDSAGW